ncbi:nucleoside triphosphatase YtkD [Variovorax sp. PBL-H6]|uniref:NUDIX domain-containing protein n=1 Tax=Variovorax sp. PBL-H6 TaxID=434009 RepID=UPI001317F1D1|nr:NUDIX domain-containing protein [Variovorax sp. PBL-H6]VTU25357.1 nucleoside triphosphatase YtkD [Variovorax sp. PBL-H6]
MPAQQVLKACACLVDCRDRLLVFFHPGDAGMQLPKGTVEPGESPEDAVRRELLEESGIVYDGELVPLGTLDRERETDIQRGQRKHSQLWHLFLMRTQAQLPERFEHTATGSPEEHGLVFRFSWLAPDAPLDGFTAPYVRVIDKVRAALAR